MTDYTTPDGRTLDLDTDDGLRDLRIEVAKRLGWTNIRVEEEAFPEYSLLQTWGTAPDGYERLLPNWPHNDSDALTLIDFARNVVTITNFGHRGVIAVQIGHREESAPTLALAVTLAALDYME